MNILITGITGFVGSHLAEYIANLNEDHNIFGLCRWRSPKENLKNIISKIKLVEGNLLDLPGLIRIFDQYKFSYIFHLAAQSYVMTSYYSAVIETLQSNIIGTANLLEAIRLTKQDPIIHVCGSSEVYGQVDPENIPIKEDCPFKPASPYAVSKVGEDMLALQYWLAHRVKTIRTRMFSHTGPRRGDVFAMSFFAKQIAAIELGLQENIMHVGNLSSVRTFCDVRDVVKAYWLLVHKCQPGEVYNIGGRETMTIREALDLICSFSISQIKIESDPNLFRPTDVTLQIPSSEKFAEQTGWYPEIKFKDTVLELLNYWREELKLYPWKAVSLVR